jgi:hypothetical protein
VATNETDPGDSSAGPRRCRGGAVEDRHAFDTVGEVGGPDDGSPLPGVGGRGNEETDGQVLAVEGAGRLDGNVVEVK